MWRFELMSEGNIEMDMRRGCGHMDRIELA
jgi:hypothetical protein